MFLYICIFSSLSLSPLVFIYLKKPQSEKEGQRTIFHPLAHFPNSYNSQIWARLTPSPIKSIFVSHIDDLGLDRWGVFCLLRHLSWKLNWNLNWSSIWGSGGLLYCFTKPALLLYVKMSVRSCSIFMSHVFCLAWCPPGSIALWQMVGLHLFCFTAK